MKQRLEILVRGKDGKEYGFEFKGDPKYLKQWREEAGFHINEIYNVVPLWAVELGLTRPWIRVQDFWNVIRLW